MKKSTIATILAITTASALSIGAGYALAMSEQTHVATTQTSESSTIESSTIESTESTESTELQPSAAVPEWYNEAESYVPEYADMVQLGHDRNSTFPVDTAIEGMADAIACMAQYPENDGSYMVDMLRAMMLAKGYPTDKPELREDLITRAFYKAGWQTAPNEEGYVQP